MECSRIPTPNFAIDSWKVKILTQKKELFVPEFCVYLFAIERGEAQFSYKNESIIAAENTVVFLPPLPQAAIIDFEAQTMVSIFKVEPWYFLAHFSALPAMKKISVDFFTDEVSIQLISYLEKSKLQFIAEEKIQLIKKIWETKEDLMSAKQLNRYLKAWFGLTFSKLQKVSEFEAFIKQDCQFGTTRSTLIEAVDYDNFHDYSHFSHTFKSMTGMAPESYLENEGSVQSLFW